MAIHGEEKKYAAHSLTQNPLFKSSNKRIDERKLVTAAHLHYSHHRLRSHRQIDQ